jgi:hypothetical protein
VNPRFPIFIPTKGRWEKPYTIRAFQHCGIPFKAVVEPQEVVFYAPVVGNENILVLPHRDKGLTVTRNWIWDYAAAMGTEFFWTFDDNITEFFRLHQNIKYRCDSGTFLRVIEDFVLRYENLYITGMQYEMFAPRKRYHTPFTLNTRVYSNMLIRTDIPFRNQLVYNDDTDLCLRILKAGHCTCHFIAFLANKKATMAVKGGMTTYYKQTNRRLEFAQELQRAHPDVVKVVWKWRRWHHEVNYGPFRNNKLRRRPGVEIQDGVNNYGMQLTGGG